jgi:menaquinone-dependent protoporphyrinogen IX oxidase
MKPIGVFYATREGHTQRIAEFIATGLGARGLKADVRNLADGASIHLGNYRGRVQRKEGEVPQRPSRSAR